MLRKNLLVGVAVSLGCASVGFAQFFDTFEGASLAPHWDVWPTPQHLQHTVSGGRLTVTGLPLPSHPHVPTNEAIMVTAFNPVAGDFVARIVLGWEPGQLRGVEWFVATANNASLGGFAYNDEPFPGGGHLRVQGGQGQSGLFPDPLPGIHEFAIARSGNTLSAYMDGELLIAFPAQSQAAVGRVGFTFWTVYPNQGYQPMYLDLVEVIPAPGGAALALIGGGWLARRRRSVAA